jgi:hypothetical protein
MRDDDHDNCRNRQDQCAGNPPVGMWIAVESTLQSHDRRTQSSQYADEGDKARQQSADAASQHVNRRYSHCEKKGGYESRKYYVMFDEIHSFC